ncbi:MAG: hypothetical protein U0Q16_03285 [Bryobacteraceae bacterium]
MLRALVFLLAAITAYAHDLGENRATLVLHDRNHLSVTLYINYCEALHKALMPQREYGAFLVMYSTMKAEDLAKDLTRAQVKFESAIQIATKAPAKRIEIKNWNWPTAAQVKTMLQHQVMQAMVDRHTHEPPAEIRADAVAMQPIESVTIRFPEEFQRVLVVSYRPNQVWVDGKSPLPEIKF